MPEKSQGKTILIVEDERDALEGYMELLEMTFEDYSVLGAENGNDALSQIMGNEIDLLLSDLFMPGMNGLELIELLGQKTSLPFPIIVISGYLNSRHKEHLANSNPNVRAYLSKPIDFEDLIPLIKGILSSPSQLRSSELIETDSTQILVADDDPSQIEKWEDLLSDQSYILRKVSNGQDVLKEVEKASPHLILLDQGMPGISGMEVCRRLKEKSETQDIPVLLFLDQIDAQTQIMALRNGADECLSKSVPPDVFHARIEAMLRIKKLHDELRKEQELRVQELEEELQTAHDMQMGLMPQSPPIIEGFEIAGRCVPANHVGGDLFHYFQKDGKLFVSMADVTGHAMEAAIPVVMFDGILKNEIRHSSSIEAMFDNLNRTLSETLADSRTFVCFVMGELDLSTKILQVSNGGSPYPYYFQASSKRIFEFQLDAYPLGVRPDSTYKLIRTKLEPGDAVVFCSDGIVETINDQGEILGFESTSKIIRLGCMTGLSAKDLVDRIIESAKAFSGSVPQQDDITCVALKAR